MAATAVTLCGIELENPIIPASRIPITIWDSIAICATWNQRRVASAMPVGRKLMCVSPYICAIMLHLHKENHKRSILQPCFPSFLGPQAGIIPYP